MGTRRKSRELALQMLFQADMGKQDAEQVRKTFWAEHGTASAEVRGFADDLFRVATDRVGDIDPLIEKHAEHWRMERMAAVDRNLLRVAVAELLSYPETPRAVVINEALAKQLNWDNPTAKTIKFEEGQETYPIIGVVKDFNFHSLYQEVEPLVMWISRRNRTNLSIRFEGNPSELLSGLETKWKQFENRYPFHYYFVDEAFAKNYEADDKLFKTVIVFSGISVFIACLGLYGLVSFTIEQRTKEFGIRKVFGASVLGLSFMVNKKFLFLVLLASIFAIPAVLFVIERWLGKFAFKIDVGPLVFVEAIFITLVITLAAVSLQAVRAAMISPARSLKSE